MSLEDLSFGQFAMLTLTSLASFYLVAILIRLAKEARAAERYPTNSHGA